MNAKLWMSGLAVLVVALPIGQATVTQTYLGSGTSTVNDPLGGGTGVLICETGLGGHQENLGGLCGFQLDKSCSKGNKETCVITDGGTQQGVPPGNFIVAFDSDGDTICDTSTPKGKLFVFDKGTIFCGLFWTTGLNDGYATEWTIFVIDP